MAVFDIITSLIVNAVIGTARLAAKTTKLSPNISYMFHMREEEPGGNWLTCRNMALGLTGSSKSSPAVYDISEYLQSTLPALQSKEPTNVMHIKRHFHTWDRHLRHFGH